MNHRTKVSLGWNTDFNIDTDKLPALLKLLNDVTPVDYGFVGDERIYYTKDSHVIRDYGPAPEVFYVTEEQYLERKAAHEADEVSRAEA